MHQPLIRCLGCVQERENEDPFKSMTDSQQRQELVKELHLLKTDLFMRMVEDGMMPLRPGVKRLVGELFTFLRPLSVLHLLAIVLPALEFESFSISWASQLFMLGVMATRLQGVCPKGLLSKLGNPHASRGATHAWSMLVLSNTLSLWLRWLGHLKSHTCLNGGQVGVYYGLSHFMDIR